MNLLDIRTIQARLDEKYLPLGPSFTESRLIARPTPREAFRKCEEVLEVTFPTDFLDLVTQYDFGAFGLGPLDFSHTGNYPAWLTKRNQPDPIIQSGWWGDGSRPTGIVLIAAGDGFRAFLDATSGQILALDNWRNDPREPFVIARDFDLFLRGLGTLVLEKIAGTMNENTSEQIAKLVGGVPQNEFWKWIVED